MQNLEKRVAALERSSSSDSTVMFIHFVGPGEVDKEIQLISSDAYSPNRQEWIREPGETEQEFKDRAKREALPGPSGNFIFMCH